MNLTPDTVVNQMASIGFNGRYAETGNGWACFMLRSQVGNSGPLITFGRIMFHNGKYSHVKWYSPPDRGPIQAADYVQHRFHYYSLTGRLLLHTVWANLTLMAERRAQAHYDEAIRKRANLDPYKSDGHTRKKRKALAPPNPRRQMTILLNELAQKELTDETGQVG